MAELNAKVQDLEAQYNAAVDDKNAAIRESERCQLKLQLANRLISALASEGECLATRVAPSLMTNRLAVACMLHFVLFSQLALYYVHPDLLFLPLLPRRALGTHRGPAARWVRCAYR